MGFLALLVVASMPVLQFLLVGLVGAFLASGYSNILSPDARRDTNKVNMKNAHDMYFSLSIKLCWFLIQAGCSFIQIVFYVFTPALIFASLAKIVTLHDIISWYVAAYSLEIICANYAEYWADRMNFCFMLLIRWFMPVNIAITFLIGTMLGWLVIKILRPDRHLEGLIIASCSAGTYIVMSILSICIPVNFQFRLGKTVYLLPDLAKSFCQLSLLFCRLGSGFTNTISHHFKLNSDIRNFQNWFKFIIDWSYLHRVLHIYKLEKFDCTLSVKTEREQFFWEKDRDLAPAFIKK